MPSEKNNPHISIVIPVYNERESLKELVRQIEDAFPPETSAVEYVFVDDGSTDGSFQELGTLRKKFRHESTLIRLRKRSGKSTALAAGFARVRGDIVVTLDADLQDDPKEVHLLVGKLEEGFDLVMGWRHKRADSRGKLGVSFLYNRAVTMLTGLKLHDMNSGLKAMRRTVADELLLYGELHRFIPVLAHSRGFRVTEVATVHHARKYGKSKFGFERIFAAFDLLTTLFLSGFGTRPLLVFGPPGIALVTIGGVTLIYLSALWFMGEPIGTRPLLVFGVLFVLFGVQLLSTGLLGELITSIGGKDRNIPVDDVLTSYEDHA